MYRVHGGTQQDRRLNAFHSGTFVEFRKGMVNVSPLGRNATYVVISCVLVEDIDCLVALQSAVNSSCLIRCETKCRTMVNPFNG